MKTLEIRTQRLERVVFGDDITDEKGMKQKLDEIYEILVQAKGIKGLFGTIILVGATLTALKIWVFGK